MRRNQLCACSKRVFVPKRNVYARIVRLEVISCVVVMTSTLLCTSIMLC